MTKQFAGLNSRVRHTGVCVSSDGYSQQSFRGRFGALRQVVLFARSVALMAALTLASAAGISAQGPTLGPSWNQLSPATTPEQRYISEMAYDAAHGQIVLFGGWGEFSGDLNDTWLWNGSNWTKASPLNSPPVRAGSEMAYDAAHGQVVLFGGIQLVGGNPVRLGDTWLWDGTNWTQATPQNSPPARASCAMVYDPVLGKVVMFGGVVGSGSLAPDGNDTWEWDGTNWTQVTTANSPSARDLYGMAYDAALGEVVLFGGDSNGSTFNDVWAFDGTNWTQLSPSNSPSARYGAAMDYDPTSGQIVMFGGYDGSAYLGDTWVLGGTPGNLSWTQLTPSPSPGPRLAVNTMVYDSQQAQSVLFGGYDFNSNSYYNDTWTWGPQQNFGSINVCPPGNSTPAPCSSVQTLTYNIPASATIGTINVVTQGAAGLDFSLSSGSTCAGVSGGGSCNVNVNFSPLAPGMRLGAVNLLDNSGNLLASTPIYGNGQAPEIAFGLAAQTNLGTGLQQPQGVAVDAAGNVYISDYGLGEVLKVAPGGGQTQVPATLGHPYGVAVDGAGNVFIADTTNSRVVKVPYLGNGTYGAQTTVGSVTIPYGVAVDGLGNVYIVDSEIESVVKVTPGGVQSTVATLAPLSNPYDVAVDAAGNLFVSEVDLKQIIKVTPSGTQIPISVSSLTCPYGVAVDAGGNLYVSDPCTAQVVQVTPSGTQTTLSINGLTQPIAMAADGAGNLYFGSAVATPVVKVNRSQPSTLNFGTVNVGARSSDLAISVQNIGNQLLTGSVGTVSGNDFGIDGPNSTCSTFSLLPSASCVESFYAQPQAVGTISSSATTSDNSLNGNPATQPIILSALSLGPAVSVSVTGSGAGSGSVQSNPTGINCNLIAGTPSGTCSANYSTGLQISFQEVPTNGSTFVGWGGACASQGTNQICVITVTAATSVTATFASSATTFPLSVTLVGSGGTVTSDVSGISCSVSNGTNSGTCSSNYAGGTPVALTATAAAGSTFVGWSGACTSAGSSPTCNVVVNQATDAVANFVQQNFGTVNVCPKGQSTPAPCSQTVALTYTMPVTTTIGVIQAVTQGVTGLDFSVSNGSTCTGTIAAGNSCTVNATFAPLAAGLRSGQVRLFDNNGSLVVSTLVFGTGASPISAFSPSSQLPVNTGTSLNYPNGLLTDAASNLFITDGDNHQVLKVAPNGIVTTVASGLGLPQGMAEDGGGNLFIATNSSAVVKIPAGCTTSACQQLISNPFGFQSELGVALDPTGNLFVGDFLNGQVAEVPVNGGPQTIVYNPTGCGNAPGCSDPVDLTTDTAGNLFIADFGLQTVAEVPVGCATQSCVKSIGTGWNRPEDVAVDAAGDVFVADLGLQQIVEVPFGCTTAACQIVLVNGISTVALAVDAAGDVFFDNVTTNQVFEITRSLPPSLSFALTNVGSTSTDSPQLVSLQNVGNQPLTGSVALSLGANFVENGSSNCGGGFSLIPGSLCAESFSFSPQSTGAFTGSAVFSDNTFNLSQFVVDQNVGLSGTGGLNGQAVATVVPNVVGMTQAAATAALTNAGLTLGAVSSGYSSSEPAGSVMGESPAAGTQVNPGAAVALRLSIGQAPAAPANPLSFENNYFVTGGYATAGVTLRGTGVGGMATGTIAISKSTSSSQGVPDGADIVDGYLYWEALENTATPSASTGTFLGYSITGQQIGSDLPFTDGALSGTLRVYRANVNAYFPVGANGIRFGSGNFSVSLPDSGGTGFPITEGASLVEIYRVLSPNFPLTAVVLYDGAAIPASASTQNVQGFYDAVGGSSGTGETTFLYYANNSWNGTPASTPLGQSNQYTAPLNAGNAYAAVILSTPVNNSDNDGILDAWKAGPPSGDFFVGQPGYYDVKTSSWVPLPGAKHGQKDLFVQFDYMCGSVLNSGACDPTQENLYPSPDPNGNDPLVMVQNAFGNAGIHLHLEVGNAVAESICTDNPATNPPQLCQFPAEPGVIGWKNSLEFSKLWPRNFASCAAGGDCTARFPYGQKDSYHYVLFGHSLAIPAWNSRYGSLTAISVVSGVTTISTTDRGNGINACPSRITIGGVLSNPSLNGVYNTASCPDTMTMIVSTPGVPNWSYNFASNTPPEPAIGIISGTVTSISGYSDLGGADSAVTLGLWATAPNQDMSKRANVIAGTLFHEIGHTLGLSHGGLYYDTPGSYVPTFDVNCKTNYQSSMNYLFQLDGVGPSAAIAYSNQALMTLNESSLSSVSALIDGSNNAATYPTSAWYVPYTAGSTTASPATRHCDGTPLNNDAAYRVDGSITSNPGWANGQNIAFDGVPYTSLRGYNDLANIDLRQVGATGGQFASLASVLSFGNTATPTNVAAGGNVTLGSGGTITLGSGGNITLGSGGNVTLGSGGTIAPGSSGSVTLNNGGSVTMSAGTITLGSGGNITLGSGGNVTLGSGGTITLGSGGNVTLGSGGTVTLGSGGTITLGSGGTVTIPSTGGTYTIPSGGGTITLGSGGNVILGSGGNVTLGSGGTITLGSGGNITLGSGGNVTLGSGGTIALGSGGNITLGSGGNVTLGSGGTITLGSGGNVTLGSGGNVTLGSGGNVTLGSGGNVTLGSGGNVTLGSGGTVTLGSGGNITLGSGGNVTLGSGGNVILGSGGNITLGSGGTVVMGSGGTITLGSGGGIIDGVQEPAGTYPVNSGQNVTFGSSGGNVTLGSGGNVTLGSGGNVTLGSGGNITLGSGGTVTLGSGGNVTLGSGGTVTLGSGGNITLGSGGNITLGSGGNITLGSGGVTTDELSYDTANSFVRPPPSATYTQETNGITVNWMPPVFGVVQSYTVYLSVNGGTPVAIGTVVGVNGNPPATSFTDNASHPAGATLTYTITTTLVPDTNGGQRQSVPSPPATLTLDQTIVINPPVPSSVVISGTPVQVTAYATSIMNGQPSANGLEVSFTAAGACSIASQSITNGISTAMVNLNNTGSCTITASQTGSISTQAGGTSYNAATPVSATFAIVAENSGTTPQIINFPQLPNITYGKTFVLNATDNSGVTINYNITGPCTAAGKTTGIGTCTITASAPAGTVSNITYSAASVTQSFSVDPAVLTVTAGNLTSPYGAIPSLTADYTVTGFVNGDTASVLGTTAPALSTTATTTSKPAIYPIAISAGTLSAANYTFFLVPGTLTIQAASQTITFTTPAPASAPYKGTFPVAATATSQLPVTLSVDAASTSVCSLANGVVTMNSGTGTCTIDANQAGNANYSAATQVQSSATATPATQTITFTKPAPASAPYKGTFPVAATSSSQLPVTLSVDGNSTQICSLANGVVTMNSGTGTCTIDANQTGNTNYSAASQVTTSATATLAAQTISFTPPASVTYGVSPITLSATSTSGLTVVLTMDSSSTAPATLSGNLLTIKGAGTVVIDANQPGNANYSAAPQVKGTIAVGKAVLTVTANSFSRPYNTANPTLTASYSGFATGDSPAVLSGGPVLSTTATTASLPGTYPITVTQGTLAAANYTFQFVNGTLTVTFTGSVPPSGTACNGAYSGTFNGSLTVTSGQNCVFVGGGTTGSITEKGGNLTLSGGAKVGNGITVNGGTFTFGPSTTITGSVTIQSMPASANTNQVCGTTITGNLVFQSNSTGVLIGNNTSSCAGNNVKGNLQVQSNPAVTTIDGNSVGANLQVQSNTGATQIFNNTIIKDLQCQSNSSITGGGNTAAAKQGQCAKF